MKTEILKINGSDYKLQFGFLSNKILAKNWGLTSLSELGKAINDKINMTKKTEITLNHIEAISDIIYSGILTMQPDTKINTQDILNAILINPKALKRIIYLYINSLPKSN